MKLDQSRRARQSRYYHGTRLEIIRKLGSKCEKCGTAKSTRRNPLELDHIDGRDYELRKLSSTARVARLAREAAQGLLQVLCRSCNSKKG